jgi:hypothetical protein
MFTVTSDKSCGIYQINAAQAQYILDNHNDDNRKLSASHVSKIKKNVTCDGWVFDGQPLTFNSQGNLTEGQHRLTVISQCSNREKLFETVVVTGVDPNTFSTTQGAKPRRAVDEIQRKYPTVTNESISVLTDLCQRKRGTSLDINNAIANYVEWRLFIDQGILCADSLLNSTGKFDSQQKTVRAVATFCSRYGLEDEAEILFGMLEDEIINGCSRKLTADMLDLWAENTDMPNEKRLKFLFKIFCVALDKIKGHEDGRVELGASLSNIFDMKSKSYNLFTGSN